MAHETDVPRELALLLLCARTRMGESERAAIRGLLAGGIDWTEFARLAAESGLAGMAGASLAVAAPDLMPAELEDAFDTVRAETSRTNLARAAQLGAVLAALEQAGIGAIPLPRPDFIAGVYGDPGFRALGHVRLLVGEPDMAGAIAALERLGYRRRRHLRAAQLDLIRRLQGYESLVWNRDASRLDLVSRLTPLAAGFAIDHAAMRRRATRIGLRGTSVLALAAEDTVRVLALPGEGDPPWNLGAVCDVAAFIAAHPALDWPSVLARARQEGTARPTLTALALARRNFDAPVPEAVLAAERADRSVGLLAEEVSAAWRGGLAARRSTARSRARFWVRLHDGAPARAACALRFLLLPAPAHVARVPLPDFVCGLYAYVPLKIAQEAALLPLLRTWRGRRALGRDADDVLASEPTDADGWLRRAGFLSAGRRYQEAAEASERALALRPGDRTALRIGIRARLACCDWHRRAEDERAVIEALRVGTLLVTPFNQRAISNSEADNLRVAQLWARTLKAAPLPLRNGGIYRHERIRLGYMSAEFHDHPTARLLVGVLEQHDRARFEVTAVSLGPARDSAIRRRIVAACARVLEAHSLSDEEAAQRIRALEIDIAVDLNGHAGAGRMGILARRPAPVQVIHVGNAGSTGSDFHDYIIADRTVIPPANARCYTEKIVYMPHSYQCNDDRRYLPEASPMRRRDAGLPEAGFVFCCFNNAYKIAPPVFDVWMRLLDGVPGSVLWLLSEEPYTIRNLRREAAARHVEPDRLVFAGTLPADEHLARHHLADLFLDTLPTNAHATASDALWAGLPVLTCLGATFGGRVAASLLRALEDRK